MSKGGSFENEIAKKLSLWFTEGKREDIFGRSDGSGARFTKRSKKGKDTANQGADITFTDILGEQLIKFWSIEVKTGYSGKKKVKDADGDVVQIPIYAPAKKGEKKKDKHQRKIIGWKDKKELVPWDVLDFIDSKQKKPTLQSMWQQCVRDALLTKRYPILIFRRNGRKPCICLTRSYFMSLLANFGKIRATVLKIDLFGTDYPHFNRLTIIPLQDFFDWAQPVDRFLFEDILD